MTSLIRYFSSRPMGFKLIAVFLSIVLVPMLVLAYISYKVIDARLMDHAREQVSAGMKAAWTEYYIRGEQMRYGMLQAASMDEIREAVRGMNAAYLKEMMAAWRQARPYVDIWAVTDADGRVMARVNSPLRGDLVRLGSMVQKAMDSKEPQVATELIPDELLRFEGTELTDKVSRKAGANGDSAEAGASVMALAVVTPVLDEAGAALGVIITADVLNNDSFVPDMVSYKMPGFFTSISAGDVRVATNLADPEGRSAKGTAIEKGFHQGLDSGRPVFGELELAGLTLVTMFEPITDSAGAVIGSLSVGISKERLWTVQRENQQVIALVTLVAVSLALLAALVSTSRITRPIKELRDKLAAYGRGELGVRVALKAAETGDEIEVLASAFNRMADSVSSREEDKARYLSDIEGKNRDLASLNEELRVTNEELEIAYEETQSQTEELHAINEELKLLNEDLDRKNAALLEANATIRKEEEHLRVAQSKLRLIYDNIRDFVLLVDGDYRILEANRAFLRMTGLTEASAEGRNVYAAFGLGAPDGDCPVRRSIVAAEPAEHEFVAPDGRVLVWQSFPILDGGGSGRPQNAVLYVQDATEKRFLTQKLMQADKLSSLGELVSGVAHELNNPLTGIMCFSELLLEDNLGEGADTKLRRINDASHRCKKIIENLLTFARWKRPEKKLGDINRVIRDSVDFRAYQLRIDNVQVDLDLDETVPETMLDATQVQQVLLNLLNNASDAIKEGGQGGRIGISSRHENARIFVCVEDTGKGISDDIAKKIFDPFFTTKEVGKGTGLGLSISYGIIHEHGGSIYASNRQKGGTMFVVELPVVKEISRGAQSVPKGSGGRVRAEGKSALVIDDESIVRELLTASLGGFGFRVDRASSAEDALKLVASSEYDLIVSDIKMPGLGGSGLYTEVGLIRPASLKKMVFISGDSLNPETQAFLDEVGAPSLRKPFSIDELSEIVSRVLL